MHNAVISKYMAFALVDWEEMASEEFIGAERLDAVAHPGELLGNPGTAIVRYHTRLAW